MTIALKLSQIDLSKIEFSTITNKNGRNMVDIIYNKTEELNIQLPWLPIPHDVGNDWKDCSQNIYDEYYDISLSFDKDQNKLIEIFTNIDKIVIDYAFDKRMLWFQKDYENNKSIFEKSFLPTINNNSKIVSHYYSSIFDNKSKYFDSDYDSDNDSHYTYYSHYNYYDLNNENYKFKNIIRMKYFRNGYICPIINIKGIWIINGKFGVSWRIIRARFEPNEDIDINDNANKDFDEVKKQDENLKEMNIDNTDDKDSYDSDDNDYDPDIYDLPLIPRFKKKLNIE